MATQKHTNANTHGKNGETNKMLGNDEIFPIIVEIFVSINIERLRA